MDTVEHLLLFTVADQRYALRLANVERIVRAVAITALPETPAGMLGVINIQGQIVPVLSVRQRFHLPDREIELEDRFIIAQTADRIVALLVDAVPGVVAVAADTIVPPEHSTPGLDYSQGMLTLQDDMVLLPDLEKLMLL